jgi:hypothetical protein
MARLDRTAILILTAALAVVACRPQQETAAELPGGDALARIAVDPAAFTSGVDVATLKLELPGDHVLVSSRGRPFITVAEYNAWLGTYPLAIGSGDPAAGRREAVDQMIAFELLAERARASGYTAAAGSSDKDLVLRYIRDQMSDLSAVSDEQARAYLAEHSDRLGAIQDAEVPHEVEMAALKGAVLGERLAERIQGWQDEAELVYAQDVGAPAGVGGLP